MDEKAVDFAALEEELRGRIRADELHWQQNDAKFRAVEQRVANYEEFRQIVLAAHLKPVDKSDVRDLSKKSVIWNTIAQMNNISGKNQHRSSEKQIQSTENCRLVNNLGPEFVNQWRGLNSEERLSILRQFESSHFKKYFHLDIPMGIVSDIFDLFNSLEMNAADIFFVVTVLNELSKSKRFNLHVQFLSSEEKNVGRKVLEKLSKSIQVYKEVLIGKEINEETICVLKERYQL